MPEDGEIAVNLGNLFKKTFNLRLTGGSGTTIELCVAREVIEREARLRKLTVDEFLATYQAVEYYGEGLPGIYIAFREKETMPARENSRS